MRSEFRHSVLLTLGTGTTAVLSLVYCVYAGRKMGPAGGYADFTAALAFVSFFNIALGPINGTITRFSAQFAAQNRVGAVRTLHTAIARPVALWALAGFPLILLVGPFLASVFRFHSILLLVLAYGMVYLTLLMSVGRGVLRGVQRFHAYNANILTEAGSRLGIGIALFAVVASAAVGLVAYVLAMILTLGLLWGQLRAVWGDQPAEPMDGAAVVRFVLPMFVLMGTAAGFENLDLFVVKSCLDEAQAGAYGAAFILAKAMSVVATPFHILLLPLLTDLYTRGRGLGGAFVRISLYFVLLAAGPLLLFWFAGDPIVRRVYGAQFDAAGGVLGPLALARMLTYVAGLITVLYASLGRFRFLWFYVTALVAEAGLLARWHGSLEQIVWTVLVVQLVTALGLAVWLIVDRGAPRPGGPAAGVETPQTTLGGLT
jgi:O-antigen/teichoic acid export membrane protein